MIAFFFLFVEHNTSHAHKQLLHQGFHLVEHQHTPHALHGLGTLCVVLAAVHIVAVAFLLYLFSRAGGESTSAAAARRRERAAAAAAAGQLLGQRKGSHHQQAFAPPPLPPQPVRCVADGPSSAARWR